MALKTVEIDGRTIDVDVDDDGEFYANVDGDRYTAPALKVLIERLRKHIRSYGRISVPVTRLETGWRADNKVEIEHLDLVGVHASNRNLLIRTVTGNQGRRTKVGETTQHRGSGDLYRRLTDTEVKTIRAMYERKQRIEKEIDEWLEVRRVDGQTLVRDAQNKLLGETKTKE
jgi:hypothetical protein